MRRNGASGSSSGRSIPRRKTSAATSGPVGGSRRSFATCAWDFVRSATNACSPVRSRSFSESASASPWRCSVSWSTRWFLRPLPYARPAELAILSTHATPRNQFDGTSAATSRDWQSQSKSFSGMTLYRRTSASRVVFAGADAPQRAQEGLVGQEFFDSGSVRRCSSDARFRARSLTAANGSWS